MNKTIFSLVALGALAASVPAFAQQVKAPAAAVEIPRGVFFQEQPPSAYLARDTVLFAKVRGPDGKFIGNVADLMLNDRNELIGAIINVGGFLGAGEKSIAVRLSALQVEEKDGKVVVSLPVATKAVLQALPPFKRAKPPKSLLDRIKDKAQELTDKSLVTGQDAYEKAKEQAGPAFEKAKEEAGRAYEKAKEATGQAVEKAKEATGQAVEKAKEAAQPAPKQ
ncbi:MAG: PRC-barrel domain-containing protein [Proteobacteria bacterium]|nr:PRC-barrel domain-containing protein [Pseudomonadota bacterium]